MYVHYEYYAKQWTTLSFKCVTSLKYFPFQKVINQIPMQSCLDFLTNNQTYIQIQRHENIGLHYSPDNIPIFETLSLIRLDFL